MKEEYKGHIIHHIDKKGFMVVEDRTRKVLKEGVKTVSSAKKLIDKKRDK